MIRRVGLTGSIGMGKSTTAAMFAELGIPVYDADAAVRVLYSGRAAPLVEAAFPGTVQDGVVDRTKLGQAVFGDPASLRRLEAIVHPLVRQAEADAVDAAQRAGAPMIVLDIPLLLEQGRERDVDAVVVVTAPAEVQRARVLSRPGMTQERFDTIRRQQMPDADKRARADFVVDTGAGMENARAQVLQIVNTLGDSTKAFHARNRARHGNDWPRPV
jgi:dephospho-CoA kinase